MSDYERKIKKIEDVLKDATQTELNHIFCRGSGAGT